MALLRLVQVALDSSWCGNGGLKPMCHGDNAWSDGLIGLEVPIIKLDHLEELMNISRIHQGNLTPSKIF